MAEEAKDLRAIFDSFDIDKSNSIELKEIK